MILFNNIHFTIVLGVLVYGNVTSYANTYIIMKRVKDNGYEELDIFWVVGTL